MLLQAWSYLHDPEAGNSASRCPVSAPLLLRCYLWPQELGIKVHELKTVHRQADAEFVRILHAMRTGTATAQDITALK